MSNQHRQYVLVDSQDPAPQPRVPERQIPMRVQLPIEQQAAPQQSERAKLQEGLQCISCWELPDVPLDCAQCGALICKQCFRMLGDKICPCCRKPYPDDLRPNRAVKKIIDQMEIDCPLQCGERFPKGDTKRHLRYCSNQLHKCTDCDKELKRDEFFEHIKTEHRESMFQKFVKKPAQEMDEENGGISELGMNGNLYLVNGRIPVGWDKWILDNPLQFQYGVFGGRLSFMDLCGQDKFFFVAGLGWYYAKIGMKWFNICMQQVAKSIFSLMGVGLKAALDWMNSRNNGQDDLEGYESDHDYLYPPQAVAPQRSNNYNRQQRR